MYHNILNIWIRRKREKRSPTQMYNILSQEIGLSSATLATFYRHQKSPFMDKIIPWVNREGKKRVSFADNNNSSNGSDAN
jgi:hypothetical protein